MNMNQHNLGVVSLIAAAMSFGTTAFAQTADTAPAAPAPADPALSSSVGNDVAPPAEPGPMTPAAGINDDAPPATIPLSQDARADRVKHTWPNRPLLITGLVVFGGTYGASVIVGAASSREADEKLFLPVVGPWLDLKDRDCDVNACENETLNKTLLIGSGALQGIGALTMVLGLVIPESTEKPWYLIGDEKLSVAPQMGVNETGLTAFGRF